MTDTKDITGAIEPDNTKNKMIGKKDRTLKSWTDETEADTATKKAEGEDESKIKTT